MTKIAIIGAGISGLVLAKELAPYAKVSIFEKHHIPGGRMASRETQGFVFDHGTQFFFAKTEAFQNFLKPLLDEKVVGIWHGTFAEMNKSRINEDRQWCDDNPHYVGLPKMNAIGEYLAKDLPVQYNTMVARIDHYPAGWQLYDQDDNNLGIFDWVISTLPAEQSANLLPNRFAHQKNLKETEMTPCFALMLGFNEPLDLPFDVALVLNANISWISVNSSKPGRTDAFTMVIDSTNKWAKAHFNDPIHFVRSYLLNHTSNILKTDVEKANFIDIKRWRYANAPISKISPSFMDNENKLGACGDWCLQGRVESAFTSAMDLAAKIKSGL